MTKRKKTTTWKKSIKYEIYGLVILALSLITVAGGLFDNYLGVGLIGKWLKYLMRIFFGKMDFLIPLIAIGLSIYIMIKRKWPEKLNRQFTGILLTILGLLVYAHTGYVSLKTGNGQIPDISILKQTWLDILAEWDAGMPTEIGGGMIGALSYTILFYLFGNIGGRVILLLLFIVSFLLITGLSYVDFIVKIKRLFQSVNHRLKERLREWLYLWADEREQRRTEKNKTEMHTNNEHEILTLKIDQSTEPIIHDFTQRAYQQTEMDFSDMDSTFQSTNQHKLDNNNDDPLSESQDSGLVIETDSSVNYQLPPYLLLEKPKKGIAQREHRDIAMNAKKLEMTLDSFGVKAKVTQIHRGPSVTRYEILPDIGVKVSRIVNLTDDLALALAAKDIRIEAPIPGKSAIGIEVPNTEVSIVHLREVLESSTFHESPSKLTIGLGRDISGEPIVANLAKMPHLLVAGATGSGKSVCINGIITSILYKAKPHEVKFMMIDPKMVELNIYNGIPHLLTPVVTDPRRASMALKKVVSEMERRYELFAQSGTRDLERYNELASKQGTPRLPYIVVIVDELADLMMVAPTDVEDAICRLAQMARAAGIHLIIATQRPSVDVITGVIKANIPSRIAFGVSSQADSRTILDMGGAEKLLGRGDMLYLPVGASKPTRIQGAFLSDEEVEEVVNFVKSQQPAKYHEQMIPETKDDSEVNEVDDELYEQAVQMVIEAQTASVSLLQRRLRIGYARAARLIDSMEANGIVGPYEGSKPREVLIKKGDTQIS
ncbi:DNA translocase FtsK [Microaerobacter geothermalis]|uniref:FtsK/SpoIIIE family DNA translocase n=1 Tax=Microaerobacter geothermalis TaxID=674972 RepID=UPI001F1F64B2|nr:DNA translocase FtsK [Microaerobacter geothermalis]MCF6093169.1 DNA translocase FtsK [Microaerobacter geothermalis]